MDRLRWSGFLFALAALPALAQDWPAMARTDLDAVHALIRNAHPGAIDEANPAFNVWAEQGYQQARALLPRVASYDTALAVVRYYVAGFRDGHLSYLDQHVGQHPVLVTGWKLGLRKGRAIVTAVMGDWPVALPEVGAQLMACDGRAPDALVRQLVAPFTDVDDPAWQMEALWMQLPSPDLPKRCRFRHAGEMHELPVLYRPVTPAQFWSTPRAPEPTPGHDSFSVRDKVLWIRAPNFNLQPGSPDALAFESMVGQLLFVPPVDAIVFDVRGNLGGNSMIGQRIFDAATGGLEFDKASLDQLPPLYAQWRVSDVLVKTIEQHMDHNRALFGDQNEDARKLAAFHVQVLAARAAGQPWVDQPGGFRITADDVAARHGYLKRFGGKLVLLTDSRCASACLDFADLVLRVPGAIHAGRTTSYDTVYIDVGHVPLPSGNVLVLPLKVWRNRARGNNEALVPDHPLTVDMDDDAAVRRAVLSLLRG